MTVICIDYYFICWYNRILESIMSMHLAHPCFNTVGKKSGKKKWSSSKQKQQATQDAAEWERKQKEWAAMSPLYNKNPKQIGPKLNNVGPKSTKSDKPKSLNSWVTGAVTTGQQSQTYTGDQMIGIAVLHKSCLQPVFNHQAAEDVAKMRR
jgi:hypothetical protein